MKLNQLVLLGATASVASVMLVSGVGAGVSANPSSYAVYPLTATVQSGTAIAQNQTVALMSGTFVAGEKPTTGTARIVRENGHRFLELDEAFGTSDQGPDLHVILATSEKPPQSIKNPGSYVNLGRLEKFSGAQRYPIPDAINLANFKSAAIWCRMANATFGYASLHSTGTARAQ